MNDQQLATDWAKQILDNENFCILDTETTGLGNRAEICQIALIDHKGDTLLNSLVKPTVAIEAAAAAIHGLDDEALTDAPSFISLLVPLLQAVGSRDLLIYNADYDLRLIRQSALVYGVPLAFPTSDRRGCRIWTGGGSIHCAMLKYSQWVGDWSDYHGNYKWQRLPGGDHTALGDCKATLEILRCMAGLETDEKF